jgi:hypothetical protein
MSDIQQYLLDYDRNKKEASAVAHTSATRRYRATPVLFLAMGNSAADAVQA